MRKTENAVVAALEHGDVDEALHLLQVLIIRDRRRAWWAAFRFADAQFPDVRRKVMIALVGKTYIARRIGLLIGTSDSELLRSLLLRMTIQDHAFNGEGLSRNELRMLEQWLPARLVRSLC